MKSSSLVVPLVFSAALVACGGSAFTPSVTSDDAGGPTNGDAAVDAASDAPTQPSNDASAPDADAANTVPASWCATQPNVTFCEDFDDTPNFATLTTKWNGGVLGSGTLLLLSGPDAPSAPRTLVATAGNNDSAALVHAPFPVASPTSIRVDYDLRVDHQSIGLLDAAPLVALVLGSDPDRDPTIFLYLGYQGDLMLGWSDDADAGRGFHFYSIANAMPTIGTWYGRWGIELSMIDGHITVLHEGAPIGGPTNGIALSMLHTSAITLAAGLPHDSGGTGMVSVQIDNLVLDVK